MATLSTLPSGLSVSHRRQQRLPACRIDGEGFAMPTFEVVPSDGEAFMDALWEFQSLLHDCVVYDGGRPGVGGMDAAAPSPGVEVAPPAAYKWGSIRDCACS